MIVGHLWFRTDQVTSFQLLLQIVCRQQPNTRVPSWIFMVITTWCYKLNYIVHWIDGLQFSNTLKSNFGTIFLWPSTNWGEVWSRWMNLFNCFSALIQFWVFPNLNHLAIWYTHLSFLSCQLVMIMMETYIGKKNKVRDIFVADLMELYCDVPHYLIRRVHLTEPGLTGLFHYPNISYYFLQSSLSLLMSWHHLSHEKQQ